MRIPSLFQNKYRIVTRPDWEEKGYPFGIEIKYALFPIWLDFNSQLYEHKTDAEEDILKHLRSKRKKKVNVIEVYDNESLTLKKIQGKI